MSKFLRKKFSWDHNWKFFPRIWCVLGSRFWCSPVWVRATSPIYLCEYLEHVPNIWHAFSTNIKKFFMCQKFMPTPKFGLQIFAKIDRGEAARTQTGLHQNRLPMVKHFSALFFVMFVCSTFCFIKFCLLPYRFLVLSVCCLPAYRTICCHSSVKDPYQTFSGYVFRGNYRLEISEAIWTKKIKGNKLNNVRSVNSKSVSMTGSFLCSCFWWWN